MIKRIFFFLIFLTFSTSTYAQTKVSFVDLKYLINESDPGKKINKLLIELRNKENQELKNIQEKLKKKENDFKSKNNILNDEERKKTINKLRSDFNDLNNLKNKKEKEFNKKKAEYINKLLAEVNKILVFYVNENSIDIVIKKENLITGKKDLDITKFILEELNKKKIKF
mgnify:CR=1 FL=1